MIQDQNNNIIEEISEQQLLAITGGGCSTCNGIAEQAQKTVNHLQGMKASNANVPPLTDKAIESYQKLATHIGQCCAGVRNSEECHGCLEHANALYMLDGLSHRAGLNVH